MRLRITPARAGTTPYEPSDSVQVQDHPRSRGNNPFASIAIFIPPGSPPLAREQHLHFCVPRSGNGITPARAGTTFRRTASVILCRDHPRSRGNNRFYGIIFQAANGSPPLAREQHLSELLEGMTDRITPARAGTTKWRINKRY